MGPFLGGLGKKSLPTVTIKVGFDVPFVADKGTLVKVINHEGDFFFFLIQDLHNLRRAKNTERGSWTIPSSHNTEFVRELIQHFEDTKLHESVK